MCVYVYKFNLPELCPLIEVLRMKMPHKAISCFSILILVSKYYSTIKETVFFGEMTYFTAGTGKVQDEPGIQWVQVRETQKLV